MFKFERLEIYQLALDYIDRCYALAAQLPDLERYSLASQLRRAATSVALNIAEGSTGLSDLEQARFLGMALRSLLETVACQQLIHRRGYVTAAEDDALYAQAETLARRIQALRKALAPKTSLHEDNAEYVTDEEAQSTDDGR